ncbi:MAG: 2,4-diaminopentanoate dehydrogenase [Fusobacteriaceae bacterium]
MENIKVAIWGFGAMGSGMAEMLLKKEGVDIIGVCDKAPTRIGKDMFELLGVQRGNRESIIIKESIDEVLNGKRCDVCLCATDSFVKSAFPRLSHILKKKINVVSTAEEMAYPKAKNPELAEELDRIAKENGVSILGTGINPGLMMDLLVITLTGAMTNVEHITARRVNSLSPFGHAVMEEQGVGLTKEEFIQKTNSGELAGHVGFAESIEMIADSIGWNLEKPIHQKQAPIVTDVFRKTKYVEVEKGNVAGCSMEGFGKIDGDVKIQMFHPQQIEPQLGATLTGDYITLKGTPNIEMAINPEVDGGIGTIAMSVNMIPHVINAKPGLKTMIDLPVPRAIMGDMRKLIDRE